MPHSSVGATLFSIMTGHKPCLKHVRVFECTAYVLRLSRRPKFDYRAIEGVYLKIIELGIYRVLITDDDGVTNMLESPHMTFDESRFLGATYLTHYAADEVCSDKFVSPIAMML